MIRVVNNTESTDIYVVGDIVDDRWKGWTWGEDLDTYPSDIRSLLDSANGKNVNVYINSGGGDLFAGIAISNMLKRHNASTKAIVDGLAGSSASIIAFGCDSIEIPENAYLMIHKPSCFCVGDAEDFKKMADALDTLQEGILNTYMTKANEGIEANIVNEMINAETWLTGKKAKEYFKVDTVKKDVVIDNKVGNYILNYTKIPDSIKKSIENNNDIEDIELKNKEIDIALYL
ncbi:head maturation protease, ClpP-related [Peptostreptococcus canis]|uniref:ATP-dependent Clp protease proteolytic subunit n=1 Tax=Peptostreptococcus canis TaxID=1159213 RepID=A0ABR6TMC4_9FIRM|nr:head maturation protease, ClpP-related [Peptostreptococcus canis]MBC2576571.1 Clp protease ClpP [Peptostreptococcus canis]MBP1998758.1 ATP-dependent protease ClpP protease subunit [Peptostreptococcus canis]